MEATEKQIFNLTKFKKIPFLLLTVSIVSLLLMLILQRDYYKRTFNENDLLAFEEVLHSKETIANDLLYELSTSFKDQDALTVLELKSEQLKELYQKSGISIFYFNKGRISYWSDHTIWLRNRWIPRFNLPVYTTKNATYVSNHLATEKGTLYALITVKTEYPYENEYLTNRYQEDFHLNSNIALEKQPGEGLSDVYNSEGVYLFSLDLSSIHKKKELNVILSMLFFIFALISLFCFLCVKTDSMKTVKKRSRWLSISILVMLLISVLVIYFEFPRIVFESSLFKPDVFASLTIASLGHLWMNVMLAMMIGLLFYWFFDRSKVLTKPYRLPTTVVLIIIASLWFVFIHHLGVVLVRDSSISFEAYRLDTISIHTLISLLIIVMAFLVFCLIVDKSLQLMDRPLRKREYSLILIIGLSVQVPFIFLEAWKTEPLTPLFFVLFILSLIFIRKASVKIRFSRFFVLLLVFAIYLTVDLQKHTSDKINSQKEIELAKLSSEHDVVAEMLFSDVSEQLKSDSLLSNRLSYQIIDTDLLSDYLRRTYFSGYWTKYDMLITPCRPLDNVFIETPDEAWFPCYPFYNGLVEAEGIEIENSDFYFLNNLNGRISYLGIIPYDTANDEITLFIELDSKIISEELGYPSLLLKENKDMGNRFSYAKYNNGNLVTSGGVYNYRRTSDFYTKSASTFEYLRSEGYDHAIFNVDPENTVIVSSPVVSFADKLITFSYIFAFISAIFSLSYLVVSISHIQATVTWDFKNKIQYSVIGVLFLTLLIICGATIYFVIEQYRKKHEDTMHNTMRSLHIELVHKVEFEDDLRNWSSESYFNLDELLRKFSGVFYTDINMYDQAGMLLATSRSEVFDQQLLSNRMDRNAYEKLSEENYSAFIHDEQIGKMAYQSAYMPLLNSENRFLAYLNLPYFTQPEILTQEVTNMVVAILNIYVILLLFILFLSVFLADRITQPLRFIQSRIAQLSLSKNNEKIVYNGKDEIAGLVDEYNYMVDELVRSAELLAQSERESAWREMAKQIAHEIKNPLTPMKLNIQHMQRMVGEDSSNIKEQVEKVSQHLIEQINLLTSIANEFSDFARMPKAKNKKIDLVIKLQNVVDLFENNENVHVDLNIGNVAEMLAYGDPEQFQRVIINLVKNGIQSIPEDREKQITISLEEGPEYTAIITVMDNGKGISETIQDKLFQPNFTTKTSGMGMGLAISSSIIKSMNGNIWFSTRQNEGTTFFVKLPIVE